MNVQLVKKIVQKKKFDRLEEVMVIPNGFTNLLDFDSVRGNQEERILLITESDEKLYEKLALMPETLEVGNAKIVHGHQWKWGGKPWRLIQAESVGSPVFFGHSHTSCLIEDNSKKNIEFGIPYYLNNNILVNVGAVVIDREWVLYDSEKNTATFMKVI